MATQESNYENLMCLAGELRGTIMHAARMITTAILMTSKWATREAEDMARDIEKETAQ